MKTKKQPKPTKRDVEIYCWKVLGKGISWSRWCQMNGISVRQKGHSRACTPRQRVLMHKQPHGSTNDAKA